MIYVYSEDGGIKTDGPNRSFCLYADDPEGCDNPHCDGHCVPYTHVQKEWAGALRLERNGVAAMLCMRALHADVGLNFLVYAAAEYRKDKMRNAWNQELNYVAESATFARGTLLVPHTRDRSNVWGTLKRRDSNLAACRRVYCADEHRDLIKGCPYKIGSGTC